MWSACALAAALALAPAQGGTFRVINERFTHGMLGTPRPDSRFLPGDALFLSFEIEGLTVDDHGRAKYSMSLEFLGKDGKPINSQAPDKPDLEALNSLGGSRLPAYAFANIGTDMEPGEYTIRLTVTDRVTKKSLLLTRRFQVLPKAYGLVRVQLGYASQTFIPAPPIGIVGQSYLVNCGAVGFLRDSMKKQPNLAFECRVLDEAGKPVVAKPDLLITDQDVPTNHSVVEVPFIVQLNRSGKFTIELKATDQLAKKSATTSIPITVYEQKQ